MGDCNLSIVERQAMKLSKARLQDIRERMSLAVKTQFSRHPATCPRLKTMARYIQATRPDLQVELKDWEYTPSRHLYGHVSSFGKTQEGKRLIVKDKVGRCLVDHLTVEPYRRNVEVAAWILEQEEGS